MTSKILEEIVYAFDVSRFVDGGMFRLAEVRNAAAEVTSTLSVVSDARVNDVDVLVFDVKVVPRD